MSMGPSAQSGQTRPAGRVCLIKVVTKEKKTDILYFLFKASKLNY